MVLALVKRTANVLVPLLVGGALAGLLLSRHVSLWIVILLLCFFSLVWVGARLLKERIAQRNAKKLESVVLAGAEPERVAPSSRSRIVDNRQKLERALAVLRNSAEGPKAIYILPWYMIVGPSASGKTTAVVTSGLSFPTLTEGEELEGAGPTEGCFWWISPDGIILDTAGRYADSAENPTGRDEWFDLLKSLRRSRKKGSPINGLILTMSMGDLLEHDEIWARQEAKHLRKFMDDILDRLGWMYPVYVLFSKCDLIAGFAEFFSYMRPDEREQFWGAAFELRSPMNQEAGARFAVGFDEILRRLREVRVHRMMKVESGQDWGKVFMFPEELAALREKLCIFIDALFEVNLFMKDAPRIRGAYLSSGKQMERPFEVVVHRIQEMLGIASEIRSEQQAEKKESYFVHDLFSSELKKDKDFARRAVASQATFVKLQRIACIALVAGSLVASVWLSIGQLRLFGRVKNVHDSAMDVAHAQDELTLQSLQRLGRLSQDLNRCPDGLIWAKDLKASARAIYQKRSRELVLEPAESRLESKLFNTPRAWAVRPLLRADLFLVSGEAKKKLDWSGIPSTFVPFIRNAVDSMGAERMLYWLLQDFRANGEPILIHSRRGLDQAVQTLNGVRTMNRYYGDLVSEPRSRASAESLGSLLPGETSLVSAKTVQGAFTKKGWDGFARLEISRVDSILRDDAMLIHWAEGAPNQTEPQATAEGLLPIYGRDYLRAWGNFFGSVSVGAWTHCAEATATLEKLAGPESPLFKVLEVTSARAALGKSDVLNIGSIDGGMQPLHGFRKPEGESKSAKIEEYAGHLKKIRGAAAECRDDRSAFADAREWVRKCFAAPESNVQVGMRTLLLRPIDGAETAIVWGELRSHWNSDVIGYFDEHLAGKYPFGEGPDAQPSDVVNFYRPDGVLDGFRRKWLAGASQPLLQMFDPCLHRLQELQPYFATGAFSMTCQMRIADVEAAGHDVNRVAFATNGTSVAQYLAPFGQGVNTKALTWTPTADSWSLVIVRQGMSPEPREAAAGPWSLFHLIDLAGQGSQGQLAWHFESGVRVVFATDPAGSRFPFSKDSTFRRFRQYLELH